MEAHDLILETLKELRGELAVMQTMPQNFYNQRRVEDIVVQLQLLQGMIIKLEKSKKDGLV